MMLLRTLVLERNGQDSPVNGALLCGFAIGQIASNFLVYSLDEEVEPGSSRVYIATLKKKAERFFLGGIESQEDLQAAMQVFKQILVLAAGSGTKAGGSTETQLAYHFLDLKGCKLPPARPEDHHSLIIKKALVMKVITLGISAPTLPAIESATLIVPSIRFSSQMISAPRASSRAEPDRLPLQEATAEAPPNVLVETPAVVVQDVPVAPSEPDIATQPTLAPPADDSALFQMDSTLTNLARVAQELTQQKRAVLEQESALEQWKVRLRQEQAQVDDAAQALEQRTLELHEQTRVLSQKTDALSVIKTQLLDLRQNLQGMLHELDQALER
ncbi:hypothetical protein [Pseudomonas sp. EYE_354]|uniref:hypothetical protein n=1 Tax=Pseudomonas sp. EYE_354 TaxID=2853449 RepID=UPI002005A9FC|nr:hypothetical protein [Pseudomonas sp. EYE_354]MCK6186757.1 hypothetical protein [Pseudomonas sp. EYE_354]